MYKAQLFHGPSTVVGSLTLTSSGVRFESAVRSESGLELAASEIVLRFGGHNDEQVFIESTTRQGLSIHVKDKAFAGDFARNFPGSAPAKIPRKKTHPVLMLMLGFFCFVLALVVLAVSQKNRIIRYAANKIPVEWEQKLGESVLEQLRREGEIEPAEGVTAISPIVSRLLPVVSNSGYHFRFFISSDTNINAFALPGGYVVVNKGLLTAAETSEEVAGVMAHELAHVTQKHSVRKIIEVAGLYIAFELLLGDTSGLATILTQGSRTLLEQKYSRNYEREADDHGLDYLIKAQIDPGGLVAFFEKLKKLEPAMPKSLSLLNTHPATDERIQRLERKISEAKKTAEFEPLPALLR